MGAAYLAADAAAQADQDLRQALPRRRLSETELVELEYAIDLLRRADESLSKELAVLSGIPLEMDLRVVQRACQTLMSTAVLMHLRVQLERAGRSA